MKLPCHMPSPHGPTAPPSYQRGTCDWYATKSPGTLSKRQATCCCFMHSQFHLTRQILRACQRVEIAITHVQQSMQHGSEHVTCMAMAINATIYLPFSYCSGVTAKNTEKNKLVSRMVQRKAWAMVAIVASLLLCCTKRSGAAWLSFAWDPDLKTALSLPLVPLARSSGVRALHFLSASSNAVTRPETKEPDEERASKMQT